MSDLIAKLRVRLKTNDLDVVHEAMLKVVEAADYIRNTVLASDEAHFTACQQYDDALIALREIVGGK